MKLTRRDLIERGAGLGLLAAGALVVKRVLFPARLDEKGRRTLEAFLDTLLPAGDGYPSWRETAVMPRLLDEMSEERKTRRALAEGTAWLESRAHERGGRAFAPLPEAERVAIVSEAAASPAGSLPRFFYRTVRDRAMRYHWAHPAAWRRAGLAHAPQPDGWWSWEDAPLR